MADTLLNTYAPLIVWTGLGVCLARLLPSALPRFLGRGLYWVGVPLQILALARHSTFSVTIAIAPLTMLMALGIGVVAALVGLWIQATLPTSLVGVSDNSRAYQGSFVLSSAIGNTGFVGLAIAPALVGEPYTSWVVLYAVMHNLVGTYGLGVFLASYFGHSSQQSRLWKQLRDVLTAPPLWACMIGAATQSVALPPRVDAALDSCVEIVIYCALCLMGMRLSQLQGWRSFQLAIIPALNKIVLMPLALAIVMTLMGLPKAAVLGFTIMAGTPSAFANLILAEEYNLDRALATSTITLSTLGLLVTIPLWTWWLG